MSNETYMNTSGSGFKNERLRRFMESRHCTLLGVGVMSKNCVDATIELSNEYEIPLMLIASRRQIEAKCFGGGYVNNWSTEQFAKYVIETDKKGKIILCRDHGGLWQNNFEIEKKLSLRNAMESAKKSFQVDIESGFDIIHIDTSIDIFKNLSVDTSLARIFELYGFCWSAALKNNREICFEIGSEEQNDGISSPSDTEYIISETINFCENNGLPRPLFMVVQTGTKVMEMKNIGLFDNTESEIPKLSSICNKYHVLLKQHNTDYLSNKTLIKHPELGIHAANVAPEFAVAETRAFIKILQEYNLNELVDKFIKLSYNSKRWGKWILPNSKTTQLEKTIISGHYVFSTPEFIKIKSKAEHELQKHNIILDEYLKTKIKKSILRYLTYFNLVN